MRSKSIPRPALTVVLALAALSVTRLYSDDPPRRWSPAFVPFAKQWNQKGARPLGEAVTPAVVGDCLIYSEGMSSLNVRCVRASDGKEMWTYTAKDNGPSSVVATPTGVHLTTESCTLETLDPKTGRARWTRWIGGSLRSAPAATADGVFAVGDQPQGQGGGSRGFCLMCFTERSGDLRWATELAPVDAIGAPAVLGGRVYVATLDGRLHCVNAKTGGKLWTAASACISAPFPTAREVYVTCLLNRMDTCVAKYDAASGKLLQSYSSDGSNTRPSLDTRPEVAAGVAHTYFDLGERPCVYRGFVFSNSSGGLCCLRADTLKLVWKFSPPSGGKTIGSPQPTGTRLYTCTDKGNLWCLDINEGKVLGKEEDLGTIAGPPAIVNGKVYFLTADGGLNCTNAFDPRDTGWGMLGGGPGCVIDSAAPAPSGAVVTPDDPSKEEKDGGR